MSRAVHPYAARFNRDPDEAFALFVRSERYRKIVESTLRKRVHDPQERPDREQEVNEHVWKRFYVEADRRPDHAYTATGDPAEDYLQSVVTRKCIDCGLGAKPVDLPDLEILEAVADQHPGSDPSAAANFFALVDAIAGDDPQLRRGLQLLWMHDVGRYTCAELGRMIYPDEVGDVSSVKRRDRIQKQITVARKRAYAFLEGDAHAAADR